MIISRKRFEEEIKKRVEEAVCKCHENFYRDEREREHLREQRELENRLIAVEKACNIDHPSHHRGETATPTRW